VELRTATNLSDIRPDKEMDTDDPGDKTQNRFRFQAAYAAQLATLLLKQDAPLDSIYCEQFEDILVKRKDGKYIGVQVKTREKSLGPFRFGDDEIMHTLKRFIKLEMRFPKLFMQYIISANCGFFAAQNSNSISTCLNVLKKHKGSKACFSELDFSAKVKKLSRLTNCSEKIVLSTLNKVDLVIWADLDNYETILANDIGVITGTQYQPAETLNKMAKNLIAITYRAATSSIPNTLTFPSYYALLENPQQALKNNILEGKKITKSVVEICFSECQNSTITLQSVKPRKIPISPVGTEIMGLKLISGGIDFSNIDLMKTLNWSSQNLFIQWLFRRGRTEAERHADHLSIIVKSDCLEVQSVVKRMDQLYGEDMLQGVRKKLDETYERIKNQYNEINRLHLLGIAGILTEDCDVWWSERFPISKEAPNAST
jgi:hypothetical protein